jgi:hypothetical protein
MGKLKSFSEFINETAEFKIPDPSGAGAQLAKTLGQNLGIKEVGVNNGEAVNKIQRAVGSAAGQPWCMAFVYYIFDQFSQKMGIYPNPVYKTASALTQWDKTDGKKITIDEARSNFSLIRPGQIFVATRSGGGHVGIVTGVDYNGKKFTTVEGNTRTKSGEGVSANNRSLNMKSLIGFIDYFPNRTPEFDAAFTSALKDKVTDVSKSSVDRSLPGDDTIGVESDREGSEADAGKASGGILGKIISGAKKYYDPGDSGGDVSQKAAADALSNVFK